MTPLDQLDPIEAGERLRVAREAVGISQATAAGAIDVARTTLVAIENGYRRARLKEIQGLATLYGISVNSLLRQEAVHVDLVPRFRKLMNSHDDAAHAAAKLLAELAKAEVELENLLGHRRIFSFPPERPILSGDVRAQAEQDAIEFRQWLGLGIGPIQDMVTLLDLQLGVRVYVRRMNGSVSGLFAFDEAVGPCILLNANHPKERRAQTAAHECGHLIATRKEAEILHDEGTEHSREERYADAFGRALLTPIRGVTQKLHDVTAGSDRLTRRHVIVLAHYFGVSREAMARRLEELKLVKTGTWDWFSANGGITDEQAKRVLGDLAGPDRCGTDANRPTTLRLSLLAAEVYRQGLLSEGQLARLLHLDRIELRGLLLEADSEGGTANGHANLLR